MMPFGDLKRLLGFSGEVALVKRMTLCVECIGYLQSSFRNDLSFSSISKHFSSILTFCGNKGHLLNLSDQLRRKFSLH